MLQNPACEGMGMGAFTVLPKYRLDGYQKLITHLVSVDGAADSPAIMDACNMLHKAVEVSSLNNRRIAPLNNRKIAPLNSQSSSADSRSFSSPSVESICTLALYPTRQFGLVTACPAQAVTKQQTDYEQIVALQTTLEMGSFPDLRIEGRWLIKQDSFVMQVNSSTNVTSLIAAANGNPPEVPLILYLLNDLLLVCSNSSGGLAGSAAYETVLREVMLVQFRRNFANAASILALAAKQRTKTCWCFEYHNRQSFKMGAHKTLVLLNSLR